MNFRERKIRLAYLKEAIACIAFGTAVGLGVYAAFLYFEIAIFGWNLGLVFALLPQDMQKHISPISLLETV
jgi:hypothetical protein